MKGKSLVDRLLLIAFLIVLILFGVMAARKFLWPPSSEPVSAPPVVEVPRHAREVILYFGDQGGNLLVAEAREVEGCATEEQCILATVQALVGGPSGALVPLFPARAEVRGVQIEESTALVNFSRELVSGHPGGSISELLTVYGLADTLAVNFPHIRQVRLLVEGQGAETLKGHVDLREPIPADFSFVRPSPSAEPAGDARQLLENQTAEPLERSQ